MVQSRSTRAIARSPLLSLLLATTQLPGKAIAREAHCQFSTDSSGSFAIRFAIRHPSSRIILPSITDIAVTVVAPGIAEVRGLTTTGINSRWGPVRKSRTDPACWTGADFEICAYGWPGDGTESQRPLKGVGRQPMPLNAPTP